jgi:hypothetical protein
MDGRKTVKMRKGREIGKIKWQMSHLGKPRKSNSEQQRDEKRIE